MNTSCDNYVFNKVYVDFLYRKYRYLLLLTCWIAEEGVEPWTMDEMKKERKGRDERLSGDRSRKERGPAAGMKVEGRS